MKHETVKKIKSVLKELDKLEKNEPFFSLHTIVKEEEFLYIKANQNGLILFASTLLKAALNDATTPISESSNFIIDKKDFGLDFNSEYSIHYIERLDLPASELKRKSPKKTWKERLILSGIFSFFVIFIILTLIGLITVFKWVF